MVFDLKIDQSENKRFNRELALRNAFVCACLIKFVAPYLGVVMRDLDSYGQRGPKTGSPSLHSGIIQYQSKLAFYWTLKFRMAAVCIC